MDRIILPGMEFWGQHGISDEEKAKPQPFLVDVEIYLPLKEAAAYDDIAHTIDYSLFYLEIKKLVEQSSFNLIEALADRIAQMILSYERVQKVLVSVEKSRAQVSDQQFHARVVLERSR